MTAVQRTGIAPGAMVTTTVELVKHLSEGGMGSVWIARHLTLNTTVAVKFISDLDTANEEVLTRFTREATAAARIKSPHVVKTFDRGVSASCGPYMVMELMEGENLGDMLDRRGRLEIAEVGRIVVQTSKALAAAHRLGIVHRDIKPDNIFMCQADEDEHFVKVLDFGIAKHSQLAGVGYTAVNACIGTPDYMSPEQIQSSASVDHNADLWALAVIAYEALTGSEPFYGDTDGELLVNVLTEDPPLPSALRKDLPPTIDAWMAKALNKDIEERFGSAMEMARSFATLVPEDDDIEGESAGIRIGIDFSEYDDDPLGTKKTPPIGRGDTDPLGVKKTPPIVRGGADPLGVNKTPFVRPERDPEASAPTPVVTRSLGSIPPGPPPQMAALMDEPTGDAAPPVDTTVAALQPKRRRSGTLAVALGLSIGLAGVALAYWMKRGANPPPAPATSPVASVVADGQRPPAPSAVVGAPAASEQPAASASSASSAAPSASTASAKPLPWLPGARNTGAGAPKPPTSRQPSPSPAPVPSMVDHGF